MHQTPKPSETRSTSLLTKAELHCPGMQDFLVRQADLCNSRGGYEWVCSEISKTYAEVAGTKSLRSCLVARGRGVRIKGIDVGQQRRHGCWYASAHKFGRETGEMAIQRNRMQNYITLGNASRHS